MNALKTLFIIILACLGSTPAYAGSYAVARIAAPVLNSPDFGKVFGGRDGKTLKTDSCGQVREMEFMALPGTVFSIVGKSGSGKNPVYRVETEDYPSSPGVSMYVDSRFVELLDKPPLQRKRHLPPKDEIVAAMKSASGSPYVWGGNLRQGISELLTLYYQVTFSVKDEKRLALAGLDCSGLLYEATNGWTPRNTTSLVRFGASVPVAGKSAPEIAEKLKPLDLIVWNGHVLIVLDRETIIESRLECSKSGHGGVIISPLQLRLAGIMKMRRGVDVWPSNGKNRDLFVVRRWFPL